MKDDASSADKLKTKEADKEMKTNLVLIMYDALFSGGRIFRDDFCREHKISERTFYRYIVSVSKFLAAYKPDYFIKNDGFGGYFLKGY